MKIAIYSLFEISRLSRNDEVTETLHDIQSIILKGISVVLLDNKDKIYKASEKKSRFFRASHTLYSN